MTYMERAARLYRREMNKQLLMWLPAMKNALAGNIDKTYKVNNYRQIWEWGLKRWGIEFSNMEYKIRGEEINCQKTV